MKPLASSATQPSSQGVFGSAPVMTNTWATQQHSDSYHTTISVGGDIKNEFPSKINETVWIIHNSLVDKALEEGTEILLKIIEIIGTIIKLPIP
jgi:hypothetical protein